MFQAGKKRHSNSACLNFEPIVPWRGDLRYLITGGQVNATIKVVALLCLGIFVIAQ